MAVPRVMETSTLSAACDCASPRRGFLTGLLAIGAGAILPGCAVSPQGGVPGTGASNRHRIDIHHHLFSPAYVAELAKANQAPPIVRGWSVAKTMDDMEKAGVATAILSVTTPQVSFTDAANARRIARESNEWTARLAQDNPGRFGLFAMLPMQDTEGALAELTYALDCSKRMALDC